MKYQNTIKPEYKDECKYQNVVYVKQLHVAFVHAVDFFQFHDGYNNK